jgi:hypothetical protein
VALPEVTGSPMAPMQRYASTSNQAAQALLQPARGVHEFATGHAYEARLDGGSA